MEEDQELLSLEQLLPTVHVDPSVLRHVRTLFYSSTKNHQHLANLSITQAQNPPALTITAMLPTSSVPTATNLVSSSFRPNTVETLPLVSNLSGTPPPPRRPTHNLSSLISLFPPSATCQSSPLLQIHLTLPNVRLRLTPPSPVSSSSVTLAQNSLTILLTTGQSSEAAGLLLTNRRETMRSGGRDVLQPAPFSASGDVAGVWVRGSDKATATLALHALAAAWWTRRNRRLPRYPISSQLPSGDWYERRARFIQFPISGGDPTIQTGVIAVRDDVGARYTADVTEGSSGATFIATDSLCHTLSGSHESLGNSNKDGRLGDGWKGGWVPALTESELREVRNPHASHHRENSRNGAFLGSGQARVLASKFGSHAKRHSVRLERPRRESSSPLRDHSDAQEDSGSISVDRIDFDEQTVRRKQSGDPVWLTERMRPLCFTRRDDITTTGSERRNELDNGRDKDGENKVENFGENITSQAHSHRIVYRDTGMLSDSGGELSSEDTEIDMEQMCRKYLNNGYLHEVRRHKERSLGDRRRRIGRED